MSHKTLIKKGRKLEAANEHPQFSLHVEDINGTLVMQIVGLDQQARKVHKSSVLNSRAARI